MRPWTDVLLAWVVLVMGMKHTYNNACLTRAGCPQPRAYSSPARDAPY